MDSPDRQRRRVDETARVDSPDAPPVQNVRRRLGSHGGIPAATIRVSQYKFFSTWRNSPTFFSSKGIKPWTVLGGGRKNKEKPAMDLIPDVGDADEDLAEGSASAHRRSCKRKKLGFFAAISDANLLFASRNPASSSSILVTAQRLFSAGKLPPRCKVLAEPWGQLPAFAPRFRPLFSQDGRPFLRVACGN